jgi:hypothetical protein
MARQGARGGGKLPAAPPRPASRPTPGRTPPGNVPSHPEGRRSRGPAIPPVPRRGKR